MTLKTNSPELWLPDFPKPASQGHKYDRGHAIIYGAAELTGATRLAAQACAKIGAGLTTVLAQERGDVYRVSLPPHIMVREDISFYDERITACLYGSGGVPKKFTPDFSKFPSIVLDADGLRADNLDSRYVLTPHEGEFSRLFPDIKGTREEKALAAAKRTGAVIVLKGPQTLICYGQEMVINEKASPYLATAGSGDVLAGMITGLCAQAVPPFKAACMAVWVHSRAADLIGPGLVASELSDKISEILANLIKV